ncbi:ZYRO0F18524p [Zygosaccharomyces rouxii]|uniref:L-serine ammonia-lyase n=2 Tax=Zygosaccharomyces rouxii TaxID=4956 RepID=C5DZ64_ZYGRC|nr:uncharacterized protein ZYRO0F18524g [Zygosaccharomyces rouxii]KAH9201214.1 catabolic L-serine/threonine dehydratase [Zygosaccharomyces rouxii]CAQ43299.1 Catabolic L-serine/threonine dehydratase [Zygosaccharomyces rouxii]CAR29075.1 ZYRO0F18524p [Zygosaccharomyces rouxii]
MNNWYYKTPLLRQILNWKTTTELPQIFIKYENLQPGGSFKSRGIGNLISLKSENGLVKSHVLSSSGGNAGLAAAIASKQMELPCTVVVPTSTKQRMVQKIKNSGAEVIIRGSHWKEADNYLQQNYIQSFRNDGTSKPLYVHPFDDPKVWEGHSTMVHEIIDNLREQNISVENVRGIVCSVGGGGLFNGIIKGLEDHGLADKIPVIAVETYGCNVLNASLNAGRPVMLDKITSLATSLGSTYIPQGVFENAVRYGAKSLVLEDKDVIETCLRYVSDFGQIVEPACGASLHIGYHPELLENFLGGFSKDDIIVIIACGGSTTTFKDLTIASKNFSIS